MESREFRRSHTLRLDDLLSGWPPVFILTSGDLRVARDGVVIQVKPGGIRKNELEVEVEHEGQRHRGIVSLKDEKVSATHAAEAVGRLITGRRLAEVSIVEKITADPGATLRHALP